MEHNTILYILVFCALAQVRFDLFGLLHRQATEWLKLLLYQMPKIPCNILCAPILRYLALKFQAKARFLAASACVLIATNLEVGYMFETSKLCSAIICLYLQKNSNCVLCLKQQHAYRRVKCVEMGLPIQDQSAVRASNVMALIASNLEVKQVCANSKFLLSISIVRRIYSKDFLCSFFQHAYMLKVFVGMALLFQTQNAVMA